VADKFIKVQFKADVSDLTQGLNKADGEITSFGDRIGKWGKMAGAAFAAAGAAAVAYAGVLLKDGVESAIADAAAQEKLALTLKNVTGATDDSIAATEEWITQQGILYGVTDDQLRPAIERMARATGDAKKAQDLVRLAMDISAGTGKSLESVTNALGRAYEGSTGALGKLGIGIDSAQLKSMDFTQITQTLADTFEGQAAAKAETFAGKMDRLKVAFDEGKETVGSFVLDAITPMVTTFVDKVIPTIADVAKQIGSDEGLGKLFTNVGTYLKNIFGPVLEGIRSAFGKVRDTLAENSDELKPLFDLMQSVGTFIVDKLAPWVGTMLGGAFKILGSAISVVINVFAELVDWANKAYNAIKKVVDIAKNVGSAVGGFFSGASMTSSAPTYTAPAVTAPRYIEASYASPSVTNNVTVNGAIDAEGTARTIYQVLQNSAARTGDYSTLGTSLNGLVTA